jgi:tRNA(Ile)-lysidine synthase
MAQASNMAGSSSSPHGAVRRLFLTAGEDGRQPETAHGTQKLSLRKGVRPHYVTAVDTIAKVIETVKKYHLLTSGDSVLIGLSGGPDSVALLHLLGQLREKYRLRLGAVYINHRIRPRAARREELFCQKLCDQLGVDFSIVRENIPACAKRERKGLEETARDFRYLTFEKLADSGKYHRIALAHHVDDRVETVLFRIFRGTGLTGLAGIPVKRGRIIRPLYDLTKREILAHLHRHHLSWCEDRTNRTLDFSRNFIRHRVIPAVRARLNPAVDRAILNLSEVASDEVEFLETVVNKAVRRVVAQTPGGKIQIDIAAVSKMDTWLRRRLLRSCFSRFTEEMPDRTVIERLDRLIVSGGKGISLPHRLRAVVLDASVVLYRSVHPWPAVGVQIGEVTATGIPGVRIRAQVGQARRLSVRRQRRASQIGLDWRKVVSPLEVRPIRPGDRFQPLGLKGSKKVGDFLTDRKLPSVYRDEIPVVCDQLGIVWLVGFEIADRVKRDSKTKEVLILEIVGNQKNIRKTV